MTAPAEKRRYKIRPDALEQIYALAGEGKTLEQIAAWYTTTYGVSVSPSAIRKKLAKQRAEREVVAKAVVREHVAKTVNRDLELLDVARDRLEKLAKKLYTRAIRYPRDLVGDTGTRTISDVFVDVSAELRQVLTTKLDFTGANKPDAPGSELAEAERRVLGRLDRLAAAAGEAEAARAARSDSGG